MQVRPRVDNTAHPLRRAESPHGNVKATSISIRGAPGQRAPSAEKPKIIARVAAVMDSSFRRSTLRHPPMPVARYAIYHTPPPDSPLAAFGAGVIGYDCFARSDVPHRSIEGIDPAVLALSTVEPRRYGFHATLMAPFCLADGTDEDGLANAFSAFASSQFPIA